jgi:hypothetical protein
MAIRHVVQESHVNPFQQVNEARYVDEENVFSHLRSYGPLIFEYSGAGSSDKPGSPTQGRNDAVKSSRPDYGHD